LYTLIAPADQKVNAMTVSANAARPVATNLSNQAYNAVSEMIRHRRLRGGEVIVEARLAEVLSISRTPLREALQRLEGEGLVIKGAGRSFIVRHVDLGEYLQSLKVREILEPEAASLAVGRIPRAQLAAVRQEAEQLRTGAAYHTDFHWRSDDNLHGLYIDHCGNEVLGRIIRDLRVTTRLFEIARLADRLEPDSSEHLAILEALEAEDAKAARRATQAHIRSLSRFALATVR
jgi:DNA-binding GntR family transcriptional regulator